MATALEQDQQNNNLNQENPQQETLYEQYPQRQELDEQFSQQNPTYYYPFPYQVDNAALGQNMPQNGYHVYATAVYPQTENIEEHEEELKQYEICANCGLELSMLRYFRINGKPVCSLECLEVFRNHGNKDGINQAFVCPECEKEKNNRLKSSNEVITTEDCKCTTENIEEHVSENKNVQGVNNSKIQMKIKRINKCEKCNSKIKLSDILYLSQDNHGFCSLNCRRNYEVKN